MRRKAEYNGWTNYETWAVALWFGNDAGFEEMLREEAERFWEDDPETAVGQLAEYMKSLVEDENPLAGQASMYSDLLGGCY